EITVVSRNVIEVQFNQELEEVSRSGWTVEGNFTETPEEGDDIIDDIEVEYNSDGTLVRLVLEFELATTNIADSGLVVAFEDAALNPDTYNEFGLAPAPFSTEDATEIVDKVKPEVAIVEKKDSDG
ncbi:hypothetical protein, partial [Chengkuizengella axinellae]